MQPLRGAKCISMFCPDLVTWYCALCGGQSVFLCFPLTVVSLSHPTSPQIPQGQLHIAQVPQGEEVQITQDSEVCVYVCHLCFSMRLVQYVYVFSV